MTDQQTERFVAALHARRVEPRPEFVAQLGQRIREEAASSAVSPIVSTDDHQESVGANSAIHFEQQSDGSDAPSDRKRWFSAGIAVAATILVLVGFVVAADRDTNDVEPDAPSSPSVTDPPPPPEESGPRLSVVDSLGFRWSQVPHDESVFGVDGVSFDPAMTSVTAGGPGLVAVGTDGTHYESEGHLGEFGDAAVWTSVDGLTWSRVPHDETVFGGAAMNSVTVGGPGLVAVGGTNSGAAVWTSVDGLTWSRVPHDETVFGGDADMNSVTVGGPGLVAVGPELLEGPAAVWTSADGLAWSRVPENEEVFGGASIRDVTAGGPGLVAVGSAWLEEEDRGVAAVWTSVDGLTWSRVPHDEAMFGGGDEQWMSAVVVGGPGLVAVGADYAPWLSDRGGRVWTSPDGIAWSRAPHETFFGYSTIASVTVGGPGLVAVGDTFFRPDSDGVAWTATLED